MLIFYDINEGIFCIIVLKNDRLSVLRLDLGNRLNMAHRLQEVTWALPP